MRIPEQTIELVRQSANIIDVVGRYVQLKKKGRNYWGNCPFHSEKTPSFSVSTDKQIFYCFGCHTGGNVFKFLSDFKKLTYVESIQELAAEYNITINYDNVQDEGKQSEKEQMLDLNEEIARMFLENLLKNPQAQFALDYFTNRNLKTATLRTFGLGYAPNDRSYLVSKYAESAEKTELAIKLGLIIKSEAGKLFDRFSGRIMFPIFSPNGRVIAFAGRTLEANPQMAKYMNSPESPVYSKSKVLYGLSFTKDEIRQTDSAILVEGYMDLLSLYQNGIKNVIAVSGTALTDEQTQLLSRYTKNVTALFDADEAGVKASMRSIEILLKRDMNVSVASLGNNEDPDSYVNKYGKSALLEQLKKATDFLEFQTGFFVEKGMLDDPQKSVETIRELLRPVALISEPLKRALLLRSLADKFKLRQSILEDELNVIIKRNDDNDKVSQKFTTPVSKTTRDKAKPLQTLEIKYAPVEKDLIRLLCDGEPEVVTVFRNNISIDELFNDFAKIIVSAIYDCAKRGINISVSSVMDKLDDVMSLQLTQITFDPYIVSNAWDKHSPLPLRQATLQIMTNDIIKKIKLLSFDQQITALREQMSSLTDSAEIAQIMTSIQGLITQKMTINTRIFM